MLKDIYGHENIKDSLKIIKDKLPPLLLFVGSEGIGKEHTALHLIDEIYQGSFTHRLRYHPDILILKPDTKVFKLELIAQMKSYIRNTAFELDKHYVILDNVHLMNKESANACLKVFEDAPNNTHFILLAENKELILDTILSRSILFEFSPVKDLKKYLPELSDIEIKLLEGCLGRKELLLNLDVTKLYQEVLLFLVSYKDLDYSEIIDWYNKYNNLEIYLLNIFFLLVSQELAKRNKYLNTVLLFLNSCKEFKSKIDSNLNLGIHFKNMLIQNRYLLEKSKEL